MPVLSVHNNYAVKTVTVFLNYMQRLFTYFLFYTLALAVIIVYLIRNLQRLKHIAAQKQLRRTCGASHSARGIYPRSYSEGYTLGCDRGRRNSGYVKQCGKPGCRRGFHFFNAVLYNYAVF